MNEGETPILGTRAAAIAIARRCLLTFATLLMPPVGCKNSRELLLATDGRRCWLAARDSVAAIAVSLAIFFVGPDAGGHSLLSTGRTQLAVHKNVQYIHLC